MFPKYVLVGACVALLAVAGCASGYERTLIKTARECVETTKIVVPTNPPVKTKECRYREITTTETATGDIPGAGK